MKRHYMLRLKGRKVFRQEWRVTMENFDAACSRSPPWSFVDIVRVTCKKLSVVSVSIIKGTLQ